MLVNPPSNADFFVRVLTFRGHGPLTSVPCPDDRRKCLIRVFSFQVDERRLTLNVRDVCTLHDGSADGCPSPNMLVRLFGRHATDRG